MPLNNRGEKKRPTKNATPQKVIIPKGMINPKETTIIEIPARLHRQPIVIAKHKNSEIGCGLLCSSYNSPNESSFPPHNSMPKQNGPPPRDHFTNEVAEKSHQAPSIQNILQLSLRPKEEYQYQQITGVVPTKNLDKMEENERSELQRDLEIFQKARRKLLESASKMTSQDSPNKFLKSTLN